MLAANARAFDEGEIVRRLIVSLCATLTAQGLAGCAGIQEADPVDLAILNVSVVSPERENPLKNVDVLIDDGRIVSIGAARHRTHAAAEIDGSGRFLAPGLIDSHVHLYHATGLKRRYTDKFGELYEAFQTQQPRSYLYYGYTTLIELNADADTNRTFQSAPLHPALYDCGQGLVISDDFMATDFDSEAEFLAAFPNFLHDRYATPSLPPGFDPADHTPAATVSKIAAGGGRCVKMYYEEVFWLPREMRPSFSLPSEAILREVVAEAHKRRMTVVLHGTTPNAYKIAAATGVDIMAHGLWDWDGALYGKAEIPDSVNGAIDAAARAGIRIQPTIQTGANTLSMFDLDLLSDPDLSNALPQDYIDYLRTDAQKGRDDFLRRIEPIVAENYARGVGASDDAETIVRMYQTRLMSIVGRMQERGVPFILGTDTAVGGAGWGNPPGLNGLWEMRDWARAGVPLAAIFRSATLDNAAAFGLDAEIGSVEAGKRADLLLLAKNPLVDVDAYDAIEKVILNGQPIDRATLSASAAGRVGVRALDFSAADGAPFQGRLWYPASGGELKTFGASRIRPGYEAAENGEIAIAGRAPLIVLLHGSGGSAESMAWIALGLARLGAIVVAVDHPASSAGDPERRSILDVWEQPRDARAIIDHLLQSDLSDHIDPERIAVAGFSLGGASAMLLAGARLDFQKFPEFCQTHDDGACRAFRRHFASLGPGFYKKADADHADNRIKAAVAIAPGFTEAMSGSSIHLLKAPVLLISGARDQQLPPQTHVRPILDDLRPPSRYREIADAQHFSFLPLCGAGANDVLAETNEEFVCEEVGDKTRAQIHEETLGEIAMFLCERKFLGQCAGETK